MEEKKSGKNIIIVILVLIIIALGAALAIVILKPFDKTNKTSNDVTTTTTTTAAEQKQTEKESPKGIDKELTDKVNQESLALSDDEKKYGIEHKAFIKCKNSDECEVYVHYYKDNKLLKFNSLVEYEVENAKSKYGKGYSFNNSNPNASTVRIDEIKDIITNKVYYIVATQQAAESGAYLYSTRTLTDSDFNSLYEFDVNGGETTFSFKSNNKLVIDSDEGYLVKGNEVYFYGTWYCGYEETALGGTLEIKKLYVEDGEIKIETDKHYELNRDGIEAAGATC
jgi:hypothetical protein